MLSKEKKLELLLTALENLPNNIIDDLYNNLVNKKILYSKNEVYEYYNNNKEKIKAIIEKSYGEFVAEIFDYALSAEEIYPLTTANFLPELDDECFKFFTSYISLYDKRLVLISVIMAAAESNEQVLLSFIKNIYRDYDFDKII